MTSALAYLVFAVVGIAAVKTAYWLGIRRLLPFEERADEIYTVETGDGWKVKLFRHRSDSAGGEPVLLVHGFSTNHWNLTLPYGDGLVDTLLEKGYDCWAIDLRGTRSSIPPSGHSRYEVTFDGMLLEDLPAAIEYIQKHTGRKRVHWIGHSMGGMLLYAYELVHGRDAIASGTTLGSPPGLTGVAVASQQRLMGAIRRWPRFCEMYMRAIVPIMRYFKPKLRVLPVNWENLHPEMGPAAFYNLAELPSPHVAETFLKSATDGEWRVKDGTVDVLAGLTTLRTPLLVVSAPLDPVATSANVQAFYDGLPSSDKRMIGLSKMNGYGVNYDHIDLAFSRGGEAELYKPIADWIEAHPIAAAASVTVEHQAKPERIAPSRPAPPVEEETPAAEPLRPAVAAVTAERGSGLWGSALKNAANIMSNLDGSREAGTASPGGSHDEQPESESNVVVLELVEPTTHKKKSVTKRAAAKKASSRKPKAKKAGQKKKIASKKAPKRAAKGKKSAAKKPAKKKVAKKKAAKKKPAKKKAAAKKASVKKKAKKKSPGKKAATKKTVSKKTAKKKPSKKKAVKKKKTASKSKAKAPKKKPAAKRKPAKRKAKK